MTDIIPAFRGEQTFMPTSFLEIVELPDGRIELRRAEDEGSLVILDFSEDAKSVSARPARGSGKSHVGRRCADGGSPGRRRTGEGRWVAGSSLSFMMSAFFAVSGLVVASPSTGLACR